VRSHSAPRPSREMAHSDCPGGHTLPARSRRVAGRARVPILATADPCPSPGAGAGRPGPHSRRQRPPPTIPQAECPRPSPRSAPTAAFKLYKVPLSHLSLSVSPLELATNCCPQLRVPGEVRRGIGQRRSVRGQGLKPRFRVLSLAALETPI
jgi:hypothetical protein